MLIFTLKSGIKKFHFPIHLAGANFQTALNAKLTPEMDYSELADTVKLIMSLLLLLTAA